MIPSPFLRTALCAMIVLTTGHSAAQTSGAQTPNAAPPVHPLAFVQTAAACVHKEPMNVPTEWYPLLQRAQIWSLIYGTSVAEAFSKKPDKRPSTCAADMKRLAAELAKAEANVFAPGWRKARVNPSAAAFFRLDPAYAAGWCNSVTRHLSKTAVERPSSIGLDKHSEQGRTQIASLLRELDGITFVMDEWKQTSTWTLPTTGKTLDYTFLAQQADYDYDLFYWKHRNDETEKAVLRLAKVAFSGEGGETWPNVLVNRLRLNVELGACREAARRIMIEE